MQLLMSNQWQNREEVQCSCHDSCKLRKALSTIDVAMKSLVSMRISSNCLTNVGEDMWWISARGTDIREVSSVGNVQN
ncbi:hypothetical protein LIER_31681 [Lithospermum erythrorhizon]|uniref:Uncharacterized protein n=1 Tax=Lithospermum erythrorhizon TaxID=34254 RepID=A0AAV3RRT1_LITER